VSWFPREGEGAEGGGNVLWELWTGGGVNGCGGREAFDGPESVERAWTSFLGSARTGMAVSSLVGQDRTLTSTEVSIGLDIITTIITVNK
jgi:hypothetical protein